MSIGPSFDERLTVAETDCIPGRAFESEELAMCLSASTPSDQLSPITSGKGASVRDISFDLAGTLGAGMALATADSADSDSDGAPVPPCPPWLPAQGSDQVAPRLPAAPLLGDTAAEGLRSTGGCCGGEGGGSTAADGGGGGGGG